MREEKSMKASLAVLFTLIGLLFGSWDAVPLESGQATPAAKSAGVPMIYAQPNLQGPARAIERDFSGHSSWEGKPHRIRSIRVPPGWYVVLYSQRDFRGRSEMLSSSWTPQPRDYWYGRIRSIKVYKGNPRKQQR
jgi:hypothetical protein